MSYPINVVAKALDQLDLITQIYLDADYDHESAVFRARRDIASHFDTYDLLEQIAELMKRVDTLEQALEKND